MSDQLENWTEEVAEQPAQGKGKGRKGGKKGGKGGKKGGKKGGYDGPRRPRRFQVDAEMEKEGRSVEELKEEMTKVEGDMDALREKISKLKDQKKQENDEERETQMQAVLDEISEKKAEKKAVDEDLQKIQHEISVYQVKLDEIYAEKKAFIAEKTRRKKENGVNYTEEDVAEAIRKVEEKHETCGGLSSRSERNFMTQLRKLEQVKATLKDLKKYDLAADEKEKAAKELKALMKPHHTDRDTKKEEMKAITTEISKLNKKLDSMKGGHQPEIDNSERQLERLAKQVRALKNKVSYKENKEKHAEEMAKYEEDEKRWKEEQEKKRAEEEENRKRTDEDYRLRKERDEERAAIDKEIQEIKKQDPWRDEVTLCDNLIAYCEKLIGKTSEKDKPAKKELTEKEKMDEAMKKIKEQSGNFVMVGKTDDSKDDWLLSMKKPKAKPAQPTTTTTLDDKKKTAKAPIPEPKEKEAKPTTVSHSFEKFKSFDELKVDTPMTVAEVTKTIELLQKRKEWFVTAEISGTFEDWRTEPPKKELKEKSQGPRKGGKGSKGGKGGKGKKAGGRSEE